MLGLVFKKQYLGVVLSAGLFEISAQFQLPTVLMGLMDLNMPAPKLVSWSQNEMIILENSQFFPNHLSKWLSLVVVMVVVKCVFSDLVLETQTQWQISKTF